MNRTNQYNTPKANVASNGYRQPTNAVTSPGQAAQLTPVSPPANISNNSSILSSHSSPVSQAVTPNNVPRSAVTAKTYGPNNDVSDSSAIVHPIAAPIRNITSAGQPHSSKQAANIIQIQRTTMINNNSTGF